MENLHIIKACRDELGVEKAIARVYISYSLNSSKGESKGVVYGTARDIKRDTGA